MASLSVKASDGKTLTIQIPPGTDPSKYGALVDEVMAHYNSQNGPLNPANYPAGQRFTMTPTGQPTPQATPEEVRNEPPLEPAMGEKIIDPLAQGMATAQLGELGLTGVVKGAEALSNAPGAISEGLNRLLMTPKSAGATPSMIERAPAMAKALPGYLTEAESAMPGLGDAVSEAAKAGMGVSPEASSGTSLITRGAQDVMKEPINPPQVEPNTSMLQQPISQGLGQSAEMTRDIVAARTAMYGDAISNTIKGLENTGTSVDAKPILDQIEGMYERLPDGTLATEGVQGDTNAAISDALESVKNVLNDGKISWTDANRVKSLLQDSANYAAKRYDMSNEAYKTVAGIIKDGIDNQATQVLSKTGGDISNFQMLRQAYGQSKYALEAAKRAAAGEIGAGSPMQQVASGVLSTAKKAATLGIPAYLGVKVLGKVFGNP